MQSIMQYTDKGYDVEIWLVEHDRTTTYTADIKHPCGELVEGMECIESKRNAVAWAVSEIEKMPYAYHEDCENDYCVPSRYLRKIRGKQCKNS